MARGAYSYEVPVVEVGGLPVAASENLLLLVQRCAGLASDQWWQEIVRRIWEKMSQKDIGMKFLVPVPLLDGLVLQCEIAVDEFGWHLFCDTNDAAFFKFWFNC